MPYDVFVSYSSHDLAWAKRLAQGLSARGVHTFFDQDSLRDGSDWEDRIEQALLDSRHLVCLWSAHAGDSDWVHRELGTFRASPMARKGEGKLLLVQMDGSRNNAYARLQQVVVEDLRRAYGDPAQPMTDGQWTAFVDRIHADLRTASPTLNVPIALLTLTADQAKALGATDRARISQRLGIDAAGLSARYGDTHFEWRPFGSATVAELLEGARARLNQWLAPEIMAWEFPGEAFWTDSTSARDFARRMASSRLGAIVIDPVAMLVTDVQSRLGYFTGCLRCESVSIIAAPTAPASEREREGRLRDWLGEFASTLFDSYLEPPRAAEMLPHARYGVGLSDADEMRRMLQRSVGEFMRGGRSDGGPKHPITSFGAL